jgi:hypothetical protein
MDSIGGTPTDATGTVDLPGLMIGANPLFLHSGIDLPLCRAFTRGYL